MPVNCPENKCPICGNLVQHSSELGLNYHIVECPNSCYRSISRYGDKLFYMVYLFNVLTPENKVKEKIKYWKENERYLAEILTK
jgi:hypothetical protein